MKYLIYRIKDSREVDYRSMQWDFARENGFSIGDYEQVHEGYFSCKDEVNCTDPHTALEILSAKFNICNPISASDVICLEDSSSRESGERSDRWFYCDPSRWVEITGEFKSFRRKVSKIFQLQMLGRKLSSTEQVELAIM